jgi:UDP:flavonoid glycosyltransferase YjiC (YdhE family)
VSARRPLRVLFSVYPFPGHLFPLVSTAWALRAAGHEVLLAGFQGPFDVIAKTGLPFAEVVEFPVIESLHRRYFGSPEEREADGTTAAEADPNPITGLLSDWSDAMADGTVELARRWAPDLVVHDPVQAAGPLAAAALSVPAVEHRCGFHDGADDLVPAMRSCLTRAYRRNGVRAGGPAGAVVDVAPPSMTASGADVWATRFVPYGSGGLVPGWAVGRSSRPRVLVTLGTTTPEMLGLGHFKSVVEAAKETDAEFVLALGGVDPAPLGELPPNVRSCGWVPLHVLLAGCTAIVHQGGVGTTLSALDAGVPQLVLPTGADNFVNAAAVEKRGLGLVSDPGAVAPATLARLLDDAVLGAVAREVRAEMHAVPAPADVVGRMVELAEA